MVKELHFHYKYRSDIDGLRAVAILMVVFYHAFPHLLQGGFVGVDVFFVISGFLITQILQREIEHNRLDILGFYSRRVNRIYPSLLVLLFASIAVGWLVLLADEYKQLSEYILSSVAFLTNYLILGQISYFDNSVDSKPLINLWSLAVEEQFYIFFPIILYLIKKARLNPARFILLIALISFALNVYYVSDRKSDVFFQPQFRAWEFLVGSLLCFIKSNIEQCKANNGISVISTLLLVISLFLIKPDSNYPSIIGVLPVVGAAGLIYAGENGFINKFLLSNKYLVWIGLISYPLYLFHWPILSIPRMIIGKNLPFELLIALVLLSVVCAATVFNLIEKPLKTIKSKYKSIILFLVMLCVGFIALYIFLNDGLVNRQVAHNGINLTKAKSDWEYTSTKIVDDEIKDIHELKGLSGNKVIFLGSSLVGQYFPRVTSLYENSKKPLLTTIFASRDHCNPYPGDRQITHPENVSCQIYYKAGIALANSSDVVKVVFGGKWPKFIDESGRLTSDAKLFIEDINLLRKNGKQIVILSNPPHFKYYAQLRANLNINENLSISRGSIENNDVNKGLETISKITNSIFINVLDDLCNDGVCPIVSNGMPLYLDSSHITATYSKQRAFFIDAIVEY